MLHHVTSFSYSGAATTDAYENILRQLVYVNSRPEDLSNVNFLLKCSGQNERYVSNEFQVTVRPQSLTTRTRSEHTHNHLNESILLLYLLVKRALCYKSTTFCTSTQRLNVVNVFQMVVVHTSHVINEAPRQSVLPQNAGPDYIREETQQQKMRAYPQRASEFSQDFSTVSKGSGELDASLSLFVF